MKKILTLILCCFMVLAVMSACAEEEHKHTFSSQLEFDSEYHWYPASCEHTEEVSGKEAHVDENNDGLCDVCGTETGHEHTFETQWTHDAKNHWHKATCGHQVRNGEAAHDDKNNDGLCDVCAYDYDHKHTYADKPTLTENGHWNAPSCGHDVPGINLAEHDDPNNDGLCDACGYDYGHTHTYANTWNSDDSDHWKDVTCGHNVPVGEKGKHVDDNTDGKCDVCERVVDHFHSFDETQWIKDETGHWYAATCEHADQRKNEAPHDGYELDGICATCGYVVFEIYDVTLNNVPDYVQVLDTNGELLGNQVSVREGSQLVFQLVIPDYAKFEGITGASISDPIKDGSNMIYTVTITVNADLELYPVINKLTGYDKITEGSGVIETEGYKAGTTNITFQAPAAGTYAIYSLSSGDVQFTGANGTTFTKVYTFTVENAGEHTVKARCYGGGNGTVQNEFTYLIVKLEDKLTLPALEGSGYFLPTMIPVDVYVTLPKAGIYQLTTSWDNLTWDDDMTKPFYIVATKDNQTVKMVARHDIHSYPVKTIEFKLDWKIERIEPQQEMNEGDNKVIVPYGKQYCFSFTAPKTGSYQFTNDSKYVRLATLIMRDGVPYFEVQGNSHTVTIKGGQTVELYMNINIYALPDEMGRDPIEDTVHVEYTGNVPAYDAVLDGYLAAVDAPNTFIVTQSGDYKIILPAGASISFDGGQTWTDETERVMALEAGTPLVYNIRGTEDQTEVLVKIQYINYKFNLDCNAGDTAVTMIPGKQYTVTLSGSMGGMNNADYILDWSEKNITVLYGGNSYTTGPITIDDYTTRSNLIIIYKGENEKEIVFNLQDNYQDPGQQHEHTFSDKLTYDETHHWYAATCEHTAQKKDYAQHKLDSNYACSCGFKHEHTFSDELTHDENGHWYAATCAHTAEKKGYAAHKFDGKGICACGYEHVHTYNTQWSKDENKHWIASDCNHGVANKQEAAHDYNNKGICKTCGYEHKHTYASVWTNDDSSHWHAVTCGHDVDVADLGAHNDANKDGKCDTCQLVVAHYHTFDTSKWMIDDEYHWYASTCGHEDAVDSKAAHDYDAKGICKTCKFEHKHTFETTWSKDENKHWHASNCNHGIANKDESKHNYDAKGVCKDCGYEHKHSFATTWSKDETNHWYAVTCGHEVELTLSAHSFNEVGICTVCQYEHVHTYDPEWSVDETKHWHASTCNHGAPNKDEGLHVVNNKGVCACGWEHKHEYESNYTKLDKENHGCLPICGCDIPAADIAPHLDTTNDKICEDCGWDFDHTHSYSDVYTGDDTGHWIEANCGCTIPIKNDGEHVDTDINGVCDLCGVKVPIDDPILNLLNGEFAATVFDGAMELYKMQFKPAGEYALNGDLVMINDSLGSGMVGVFKYTYDPTTIKTTGLKITDANGKVVNTLTIKSNDNDELILISSAWGSEEVTMTQLSSFAGVAMKKVWEDSVEVVVENSQSTEGHLIFTAPFTGSFELKPSAGTKNVVMFDHWGTLVSLPYKFTAREGETVNFTLATEIRNAGTYKLKVQVRGAEGEFVPSADRLLLGTNSVVVTHASEGGNAMYFCPSESGTYKFTVVDGMGSLFSYSRDGSTSEYGDEYEVHINANGYFDLRVNVDMVKKDGYIDWNDYSNGGTVSNPVTVIVLIEKVD